MQAEMGLSKAFPKAIDLCFRQRKSLQNQNHFVTFLNQLKGVCPRGETDTLSFALKDVILYDLWQVLLKLPSEHQARDQAGLQPPEMVLHGIWFTDARFIYWSTCTNPMARIKPSVDV